MTLVDDRAAASSLMARIEELAPVIAARALEGEQARRTPPDLVEQLRETGVFSALRPKSHGGAELSGIEALRLYERLARADGSVGWNVMIGSGGWLDLATLPRATFDMIFDDSGVITAGVFNPTGSIEPDGDGYRVSGRWAFASGCQHATWIFGNCVEGMGPHGPELRGAVFRPEEVTIEDTWYVSGLRGTGSHHIVVDDVHVERERTFIPLVGEPCIDMPLLRIPIVSALGMAVASVAIGIATGALDDIVELATTKLPLLAPAPLATDVTFHQALAQADTELAAARSLLHALAAEAWELAVVEGVPFDLERRARMRAAAVWATTAAVSVTQTAYRMGGGSSLAERCPLQRRLRDVEAVAQHFLVKPGTMVTAGAILAGQPLGVPVF